MTAPKPPLPENLFDPWPRIDVDQEPGTPFHQIVRTALHAANDRAIRESRDPQASLATLMRYGVTEALLHLLELGLIDIDAERVMAAKGYPVVRSDFRPEE